MIEPLLSAFTGFVSCTIFRAYWIVQHISNYLSCVNPANFGEGPTYRSSFCFKQICLPPAFTLIFLLGLFFDHEDGGDMFLRNIFDFQRTTRSYIPEDRTLHKHRCENLKSCKGTVSIQGKSCDEQSITGTGFPPTSFTVIVPPMNHALIPSPLRSGLIQCKLDQGWYRPSWIRWQRFRVVFEGCPVRMLAEALNSPTEVFHFPLSPSRGTQEYYLERGHDHFNSQLVIHWSSYH
jgi:hypothetical protein